MSITFGCENCGKSFTVDDKSAGKKGRCKQCGAVMPIPMASASAADWVEASPPRRDVEASRRPPALAPARASAEDIYGIDDPPRPSRAGLPSGIEEVEPRGRAGAGRFQPRPDLLYRPASSQRQGFGRGPALGGVFSVVAVLVSIIWGAYSGIQKHYDHARTPAGLTSRAELEAMLQERVTLHDQLAAGLAKVDDVESARQASPETNRGFRAITANLRKMKFVKALQTDLDALKGQYTAPQLRAGQEVLRQILRIAAIPGAGPALDVQEAANELDREEKSIPGMSQATLPPALDLPQAPPRPAIPPALGTNPNFNPQSGPQAGPRQGNRPKLNSRRGANRPNPDGPG